MKTITMLGLMLIVLLLSFFGMAFRVGFLTSNVISPTIDSPQNWQLSQNDQDRLMYALGYLTETESILINMDKADDVRILFLLERIKLLKHDLNQISKTKIPFSEPKSAY